MPTLYTGQQSVSLNQTGINFFSFTLDYPHASSCKREYMELFRENSIPRNPSEGQMTVRISGSAHMALNLKHAAFAAMIKQLDDYVGELMQNS